MSLQPSFSLPLGVSVQPGLVTAGRFDGPGKPPQLACATTAGKVSIHRLDRGSSGQGDDVSYLNINRKVTAIAAGRLEADGPDLLFVGTATDLLAYDVALNRDVFFKELPDGVLSIIVGQLGQLPPLVLVGGSCSIYGFDSTGEDLFWTVTGDDVSALALCDVMGQGSAQLVVGSEDYDIRLFNEDAEMIWERAEAEAITSLCPLQGRMFAYTLANGAVGVYEGDARVWTTKSKLQAMGAVGFDINLDGVPELVCGWADGRVDVRDMRTGSVLLSHALAAPVAGMVRCRLSARQGTEALVVLDTGGRLSGYQAAGAAAEEEEEEEEMVDAGDAPRPDAGGPRSGAAPALTKRSQVALQALKKTQDARLEALRRNKQDLMLALHRAQKLAGSGGVPATIASNVDAATHQVRCKIRAHPVAGDPDGGEPAHLRFVVSLHEGSPDAVIRLAVFTAEEVFDGREAHVVQPPRGDAEARQVHAEATPPKNTAASVHVRVLIGTRNSVKMMVREATLTIPPFALFLPATAARPPESTVEVPIGPGRSQDVLVWANTSFFTDERSVDELQLAEGVSWRALRDASIVSIRVSGKDSNEGTLFIRTDDVHLAGDIVQSLAKHLGATDLPAKAHVPGHLSHLAGLIERVGGFNAVRQRLTAEMADQGNLVKSLVVRAEDARLLGDMPGLREACAQLRDVNRDMVSAYRIRSSNHEELLSCLRQVNRAIQAAGRLRVGRPEAAVVTACRRALKANDVPGLMHIVADGMAVPAKASVAAVLSAV